MPSTEYVDLIIDEAEHMTLLHLFMLTRGQRVCAFTPPWISGIQIKPYSMKGEVIVQ